MRSIRLDQWLESRAPGGVLAPMRILERMETGGVAWLGNRRLAARGYLVVSRRREGREGFFVFVSRVRQRPGRWC